jgi:hypothetical protein
MTFPKMFMKQGVGGRASVVKKVKTYGRKNMNGGVGSPKWVALSGVNIVYGVWVKSGHD